MTSAGTTIAVTGGTGFLGGHALRIAGERGLRVRALARRSQPPRDHVDWIAGDLGNAAALARLAQGVDAIVHVAGVINAPDDAAFVAGNITGTQAIVDAARAAGVRRFVHVSSLAVREPGLSRYGWSKAGAEDVVTASGLDWTIVRPPAIYGPGDREMLDLFRMARRGVMLLPPAGRLSLIEAGDLARLLIELIGARDGIGRIYEPDDGVPGGWDHRDFGRAIGEAVGRRPWAIAMPAPALRLAARIDGLARGGGAKLTPDRVRYFCHPDWVVSAGAMPPGDIWRPEVETRAGLRATAASYRAAGWL